MTAEPTSPGQHFSRRLFLQRASLAGGMLAAGSAAGQDSTADRSNADLVVVELFTSQGCNSCPPADRVLAELVRKHEQDELPILGLSFHVDYWNYLGWADPFSSPRWSVRQRRYSAVLKDRVYTPQMFVNGSQGIVGSRRKQLESILPKQLDRVPEHFITLDTKRKPGGDVEIAFDVAGETDGMILNIALVARRLTAKATRGENAGRTLTHANVVRRFAIHRLNNAGSQVTFGVPPEDESDHIVIAYVQNAKQAMVTGAAEAPLT